MAGENPYLRLIREDAGAAEPAATENPYRAMIQEDARVEVRTSLMGAVDKNPDDEARVQALARQLGVPADTVRLKRSEMEREARLRRVNPDALAQQAPATAAALARPEVAAVAHDDVQNMGTVEKLTNALKRGWAGLQQAGSGTALGANARVLRNLDAVEQRLARGETPAAIPDAEDVLGVRWLAPAERAAMRERMSGAVASNAAGVATREAERRALPQDPVVAAAANAKTFGEFWRHFREKPFEFIATIGAESLPQMLPGMAAAIPGAIVGGPVGAAAAMGAGSFGVDYASSVLEAMRAEGVDTTKPDAIRAAVADARLMDRIGRRAYAHAAVVGAFDALSGGVAARTLVPQTVVRGAVGRQVANLAVQAPVQGAMGAAGEAGGQVASGEELHAGGIASEFFGEFVGTPAEVATMAAGQLQARVQAARQRTAGAQALAQLQEAVAASKLRERSPEAFAEFVQQAAADGDVADVYVDGRTFAETLSQSPVDLPPEIREQVAEAAQRGGDVRIPVGQFAASIAGTDFGAALMPHVRTAPDAMSQAEAEAFMSGQAEAFQAAAEQTAAAAEQSAAARAGSQAVESAILEQLNAAGRFTPEVNAAYAALMREFYATQAGRLGITPDELFARYPLRVAATPVAGDALANERLDQTVPLEPQVDGPGVGAQNLADVLEGTTFATQGYGSLDRPTRLAVLSQVSRAVRDNPQILDAVIRAVPVDVVNNLFGSESAAKVALHDEAVLQDRLALDAEIPVAGPLADTADAVGLLVREAARLTAERTSVAGDTRREAAEQDAAPRAGNGDSLSQGGAPDTLNQGPRAQITLPSATSQQFTITLFKDADLTGFLHEAGHMYLEILADIAIREDAPQEFIADMNAVLDWFGVKGDENRTALDEWNAMTLDEKRAHHEQFARGFEAYLFEGRAPSTALGSFFARFRAWMVNVYRSLKNLNVTLTDDVRGVFDRMLAVENEIRAAEAARSYAPLFATPEEAGMSADEFAAYQGLAAQATNDAIAEMQARGLRDMQWLGNARAKVLKDLQKDAAERRKATRREVEAEVRAQPVYSAIRWLKRGEATIDGEQIKVEKGQRLNTQALAEMYPESMLARPDLAGLRGMTAKDGIHPDVTAEIFGYTSGDHMVREILAAEPERDLIERLTDQRMLEKFGDLNSVEAIERAADEAVHNEARARMVATEFAAVEAAASVRQDAGTDRRGRRRTVDVLAKAAREYAQQLVARKRVRDVRPGEFAAAETRAARNAEAALRAGDTALAAQEKRNQLLNTHATREAHAAVAEVERAVAYFRKFDHGNSRRSIDPDYVDQIDALLEAYDFKRATLREVDKRRSLAAWVDAQREAGFEPDIDPALIDRRVNYRDMTIEQLRGLVDAVRQIEHLGRLKRKLLTAKEGREFAAERDRLVASIEANATKTVDLRTRNTPGAWIKRGVKSFLAAHRKMASLARQMDGFTEGPMWDLFIRTMNDAADREAVMREQATIRMHDMTRPLLAGGTMGGKGRFFPTLRMSLNREERIGIALNVGNAGNLQRLLDGEGWTREQIQPVLDSLSQEEWAFVQQVWDFFESYRPEIAAKERRVYGVEPKWVEPVPVETRFGTLRGGYYPIKYDPARSGRAEQHADAEAARQQMQGAYTSSTTKRSFTKARAEAVEGRPLLYSLSGLYQGANEVIHDLAWHEWLIDVNHLLRDRDVDRAMRTHYGPEVVQQFKAGIQDIAAGDAPATNAIDGFLTHIRTGAAVAGLGWNLVTSALQPLGLTQSMVRIGPGWVARGLTRWLASPLATTRQVHEASDFMRLRHKTFQREINEIQNRVSGGKSAAREMLDASFFVFIQKMQMVADMPTWLGAYEKAFAETEDEARAVAMADQAVRDSQGGGQAPDLARIQRGGATARLFTVFYGFFNTAYNLSVESYRRTNFKSPASVARLASDYLLLLILPAQLGALLKAALQGDDDDEDELVQKLIAEQISFLLGTMVGVREAAGAVQAAVGVQQFDPAYQGPAGLRFFSELVKLGQQVQQGEADAALRKAAVNVIGIGAHLPGAQINRTWSGLSAYLEGDAGPQAILFGPPPER